MITHADLRQFTGTEQWFRHVMIRNVLYTEGVQYLAEHAQAYWLLDKIAIMQMEPHIRAEEFQVWKLSLGIIVRPDALMDTDNTATLTCTDGGKSENGGVSRLLHSEHISFTDFPLDEIELWVEGNVILLPSEH